MSVEQVIFLRLHSFQLQRLEEEINLKTVSIPYSVFPISSPFFLFPTFVLFFYNLQINAAKCSIILARFENGDRSVNSRGNKRDRTVAFSKNSIFCKMLKQLPEGESISIGRDCQVVNICKISKISYPQSFIYANV
ncbi:hypothetical protein [Microcoleus asticus]|uniref:hypothetical protein n=1 Tax=Microcoleus asticus TaxID=2815231 RepID=UPI0015580847